MVVEDTVRVTRPRIMAWTIYPTTEKATDEWPSQLEPHDREDAESPVREWTPLEISPTPEPPGSQPEKVGSEDECEEQQPQEVNSPIIDQPGPPRTPSPRPYPPKDRDIYSPEDGDMQDFKQSLTKQFRQMMFVSGETGEVSTESTSMVEEIVRNQVIEILTQCHNLALRRGVRTISTDDLFFVIRHNKGKVARLQSFLAWKDVRKNVKDSDDKGGGDAADFAVGDDPAGVGVLGSGTMQEGSKEKKKPKIGLPWDVASFYSEQPPPRDDEQDDENDEDNHLTLQRLRTADERTKNMTKEEYVHFSECRQASFTFRKGKRFREWAGFGIVTDGKPNEDIIDILGFLTFEMVQTLTEEALKIKGAEDEFKSKHGGESGEQQGRKRKHESSIFAPPAEGRTPVGPSHIQEAFRRLQAPTPMERAMKSLSGHHVRSRLLIVGDALPNPLRGIC